MNKTIKIVILGGGFGGIYILKYLHKFFHRNDKLKIILVNKKNYFLFTPLLCEVSTGGTSLDNIIVPIRDIIKCCDWDFVRGKVMRIDLDRKIVKIQGVRIDYDYLIIALGSKTNYYDIPGAENYSFSLKSLSDSIKLKNHLIHLIEKAILNLNNAEKILTFVIVGGGATGVELAGEISDLFYKTLNKYYGRELISKVKIILIERGKELLSNFPLELRVRALKRLSNINVEVLLERGVKEVGKDFVKLDDDSLIKTKTIIWTAGVEPNLPEITGNIEKDNRGRILVNDFLQAINYPEVFVIGDICCFLQNGKPLPQLAQVATKQAKVVALNIKSSIYKKPLKKFIYKHSGDLISIGKFYAIGKVGIFNFSGILAWFIWRGVYLTKMISFRNQVKTLIDWLFNLFQVRDIKEL